VYETLESDVSGRATRLSASGQLEVTDTLYNGDASGPVGPPIATCTTGKLSWSAAPRG
jgi:hypothetical protein